MKDLCQNPYDAVALVIRVPIVELLEVIEIGVAGGEVLSFTQTPRDFGFESPEGSG